MKGCSISSIISGMQIIITIQYLCIHTGKAKAKTVRGLMSMEPTEAPTLWNTAPFPLPSLEICLTKSSRT